MLNFNQNITMYQYFKGINLKKIHKKSCLIGNHIFETKNSIKWKLQTPSPKCSIRLEILPTNFIWNIYLVPK